MFKCNLAIVATALLLYVPKSRAEDETNFAYHYDRLDTINGSGEYFKYNLDVKKQDGSDSIFEVNADIEQLLDLNDDYKVDVTVFRATTKDGEYERFMKPPRMGVCLFLKSVYKRFFYESVKDYSNLPHFETCPLEKTNYWIKGYPFDGNTFKKISRPGYYRVEAFLIKDDESITGVHLFASVEET